MTYMKMSNILLAVLVALGAVFGLMLYAQASEEPAGTYECATFYGHAGGLPDRYDFGIFIEYLPPVHVVRTESQNPADYGAGSRWDEVQKCNYTEQPTTTTTVPETTTTSTPPESSTTTLLPETSTTTVPSTSTTMTVPETTTTKVPVTPTTPPSEPPVSSTPPTTVVPIDPPEELPYTGADSALLVGIGALLLASGVGLALRYREEK